MMKIKGLAGLLFVITLLPAGLAAAETFTHCQPDAGKWARISDEQLKNITSRYVFLSPLSAPLSRH